MTLRKLTLAVAAATIAAMILAGPTPARAAPADDFDAGKAAFSRGDYASALAWFERARDGGASGPAVHYNIAVTQYRLGDYGAAARTFRLIRDRYPRMRALAEYNLGLTARELADDESARGHFVAAYRSTSDEKIRALAVAALEQLPQPEPATPSAWSGSVGARVGYDSNVALRDELGLPAGQTADSPMADVFATLQGPWTGGDGFRLDASAYLVRFVDADDFDQSEFRAGGLYDWRRGDWRLIAGASLRYSTLGGDGFEQGLTADLRATRYLGGGAALDLRLRYDDIDAAGDLFPGIEGSRYRLDVRYRRYYRVSSLQLAYGYEDNDRDNPSVSPERHRLAADYRYTPAAGWGWEAGADYRTSDYDGTDTSRTEDLWSVEAALTRTLPADWLLLLQLRYSDNDSSDPTFSYDRTQVTLGFLRLF